MSDELYVLKLDKRSPPSSNEFAVRPFYWLRMKTEGSGPGKRCQHTMTFYENENLLIVMGGRSE